MIGKIGVMTWPWQLPFSVHWFLQCECEVGWNWIIRVPLGKEESVGTSSTILLFWNRRWWPKIHLGERRKQKYNMNNSGEVGSVKFSLVPCWARNSKEGGRDTIGEWLSHGERKTVADQIHLFWIPFRWCSCLVHSHCVVHAGHFWSRIRFTDCILYTQRPC